MADYSTNVSFMVPLTKEQAERAIAELDRQDEEDDFGPCVECEMETDNGAGHLLWMHGHTVVVAELAERSSNIMEHFDIVGEWSFEYCTACSKPDIDAYSESRPKARQASTSRSSSQPPNRSIQ